MDDKVDMHKSLAIDGHPVTLDAAVILCTVQSSSLQSVYQLLPDSIKWKMPGTLLLIACLIHYFLASDKNQDKALLDDAEWLLNSRGQGSAPRHILLLTWPQIKCCPIKAHTVIFYSSLFNCKCHIPELSPSWWKKNWT